MKYIEEGVKVKVIVDKMNEYRKEEIGMYVGKQGTVTGVHEGYQAEIMYSVMFSLEPFIQDLFFEHELKMEEVC